MSYKGREKKRKAKIAKKNLEVANHKLGARSSEYWLTPVKETTCCARHGGVLRSGVDMVYRHTPREALCVHCADTERVSYRPSRAWELAHPKATAFAEQRVEKRRRERLRKEEWRKQAELDRELSERLGRDISDGAL